MRLDLFPRSDNYMIRSEGITCKRQQERRARGDISYCLLKTRAFIFFVWEYDIVQVVCQTYWDEYNFFSLVFLPCSQILVCHYFGYRWIFIRQWIKLFLEWRGRQPCNLEKYTKRKSIFRIPAAWGSCKVRDFKETWNQTPSLQKKPISLSDSVTQLM